MINRNVLIFGLSFFLFGAGILDKPVTDERKMKPIDIHQIKVGGEIGHRLDITLNNNLLVLDIENDFIKPFRECKSTQGYVGLGKLIDATVRFAYYSGDDRVLQLKNRLIGEIIKTQLQDGYIGTMVPESRVWALWDTHEMGYIIYGLTMNYKYFKEKQSLDAARKLADYLIANLKSHPEKQFSNGELKDHLPTTSLDLNILSLYEQTKDSKYLDFVSKFRKLKKWNSPITLGRWGIIEGHAYDHISRCLAQLYLNKFEPDLQLTKQSKDVIDFMLNQNGMVITGECGDHECWTISQDGTLNLGETCTSAYQLRLLDKLIQNEGIPVYGDLMERIILNGLFAAQSKDGRNIRYYTPFDGSRRYFEKDVYCCPNNYRRIVTELPGYIYYLNDKGIFVNLYTSSSASFDLVDKNTFEIIQKTDYPTSGKIQIALKLSKEAEFPIYLRIPKWSKGHSVSINGERINDTLSSGEFIAINRKWETGDQIELNLPMSIRLVKGRVNQEGRIAVMRGPVVYCLSRKNHPGLAGIDLRNVVIDPTTIEGPFPDDSVRTGGTCIKVKAWKPGAWYPFEGYSYTLTLTEFPDNNGEATYFKVPNPNEIFFVDDELLK